MMQCSTDAEQESFLQQVQLWEISLMLPEILSMDAMAESVVHVIEKRRLKSLMR